MERKRPVGVIACSILAIILGLSYFWLLQMQTQKFSLMTTPSSPLMLKAIFWLALAIVYITSAIFLLSFKRWARLLIIIITSIYIIDWVFSLGPMSITLMNTLIVRKYPNANYGIISLTLLFNILVFGALMGLIIYLTRPKVKEQFR
jgi:hypothetical protein